MDSLELYDLGIRASAGLSKEDFAAKMQDLKTLIDKGNCAKHTEDAFLLFFYQQEGKYFISRWSWGVENKTEHTFEQIAELIRKLFCIGFKMVDTWKE